MDDVSRLLEEIKTLGDALPPVASWHPERTVTVDIRIDRNGQWFHEGGEITRIEMSRLFSTILRKDPDGYCLVTPVERCLIAVDDVPFIAHVEAINGEGDQQEIFLRTNMDDLFRLDADHPLCMRDTPAGRVPYVVVRGKLEARLNTSAYYELAEKCGERQGVQGVYSAGGFYGLS